MRHVTTALLALFIGSGCVGVGFGSEISVEGSKGFTESFVVLPVVGSLEGQDPCVHRLFSQTFDGQVMDEWVETLYCPFEGALQYVGPPGRFNWVVVTENRPASLESTPELSELNGAVAEHVSSLQLDAYQTEPLDYHLTAVDEVEPTLREVELGLAVGLQEVVLQNRVQVGEDAWSEIVFVTEEGRSSDLLPEMADKELIGEWESDLLVWPNRGETGSILAINPETAQATELAPPEATVVFRPSTLDDRMLVAWVSEDGEAVLSVIDSGGRIDLDASVPFDPQFYGWGPDGNVVLFDGDRYSRWIPGGVVEPLELAESGWQPVGRSLPGPYQMTAVVERGQLSGSTVERVRLLNQTGRLESCGRTVPKIESLSWVEEDFGVSTLGFGATVEEHRRVYSCQASQSGREIGTTAGMTDAALLPVWVPAD